MNRIEFEKFCREIFERQMGLSKRKGADYAGHDDVLSNFKRVAKILELMQLDVTIPEGVAMFFIVHKLDRLWRLIRVGAKPENESLRDNLDDLQVYQRLLAGIIEEKAEEVSKK